ncbi:hypothetical protein RND71_012423 [Anisodus tanguticus]|uniref:MYB transcription factor n=1 Tax=Anisodus tanguticus TaxID=243964 RepID=A0AAE1SGZ7_9SOLA|nr:hypothetical protein RND71_012423 [Anisodus tanguticus]
MGNPKQKWTSEEEEALRAGVAKHGAGKWKNIQRDPEFNHLLYSRSNIDLKEVMGSSRGNSLLRRCKDKWRNLNVSANGQGPRDKSRTPKVKANPDAAAAPLIITQAPVSSTLVQQDASGDTVMEDSSKCALDGKTASKYNQMIYDALSSLKEPNGSDISTIVSFIETVTYVSLAVIYALRTRFFEKLYKKQRHEVPQNFRRLLSSRLRRLVQQDKLEKIENCYRIKKEVLEKTKTATPKQKHVGPRQFPSSAYLGDTAEEAAITAAYKVAEAENKSFVAAEAAKEAERVSKMEEDSDKSLQVYKDIFDKCSHGEIVLLMA